MQRAGVSFCGLLSENGRPPSKRHPLLRGGRSIVHKRWQKDPTEQRVVRWNQGSFLETASTLLGKCRDPLNMQVPFGPEAPRSTCQPVPCQSGGISFAQVEDQSQTNSCCANAVAGAYEYINKRHAMQTGRLPAFKTGGSPLDLQLCSLFLPSVEGEVLGVPVGSLVMAVKTRP